MERRTFLKLAALVPGLALAGCGGSKTLLSPKDPTVLSIWHVYGEQADSPMNRLLTEFNDTVGKEKGILLNVTNMTNSAAIGGQLQDAKAGKPGALDLPDLFSAHSADASALGIENLVDWNDWFTAEDMAAYVPGFVQDGIIDGKQVVFPVSKSTQLIFLNGSQYARFAADTGAQLSTLATWDGFFEMAGAYRQWSQGKPFCALDYPLRLVELNALEQGGGELYQYLKKEGYSDQILKETGLFKMDERGVYDKFWNRVMFPIMDVNNRVIGFGGRVMGDGEPKYLNSPETRLFDKSRNLYGLNFAKQTRKRELILVEGYMDVIALY